METVARRRVGVHANLVLAADQVSGDDVELSFEGAQLVVGSDHLGPDLAVECGERVAGSAFQQQFARGDDGHAGAELADVVDDVGRENDGAIAAQGGEKIQEAIALGGIEAGGGLVDDNEPGIAEQRLGDAEALLHAAGKSARALSCGRPTDWSAAAARRPSPCARARRSCPS